MAAVLRGDPLIAALRQVQRHRGALGLDGRSVEALADDLKSHWPSLKTQWLAGRYQSQPVRGVEIAKAAGGVHGLGIPTVLDGFIQHAIAQVLQREWETVFDD
ncbi:MAG: hypothetical protein GKR94_16850 [Gammaproteobacteria bacterium]|nr:hypothetical protein [Gammaproteobacteria bacterium]